MSSHQVIDECANCSRPISGRQHNAACVLCPRRIHRMCCRLSNSLLGMLRLTFLCRGQMIKRHHVTIEGTEPIVVPAQRLNALQMDVATGIATPTLTRAQFRSSLEEIWARVENYFFEMPDSEGR
jgi:hypothetical protein